MSYKCIDLVLACMDGRLSLGQTDLNKVLLEKNIVKPGFDNPRVAGGVKSLSSADNEAYTTFVVEHLDLAIDKHKVSKIVLVNHTDCGAYGGSGQFKNLNDEIRFHVEELKKAGLFIKMKYPGVTVEKYLAILQDKAGKWELQLEQV